jgi:hypothetical protein
MAIPAAGVGFFFSAWLLMLFAGILADDVGTKPIGYTTSMLATIGLWLVIAPVVGAIARAQRGPFKIRASGRWKTVAGEARVE